MGRIIKYKKMKKAKRSVRAHEDEDEHHENLKR